MRLKQFNKLSAGNIPGSNASSAAVWGLSMTERLGELLHHGYVEEGRIPTRHLYTQKGNPEVFDCQDLIRKVNADSEMSGRQYMIFIARQLDEKYNGKKADIYTALDFKQRSCQVWAVTIIMVIVLE